MPQVYTSMGFSEITDRNVGRVLEWARVINLLWRGTSSGRFIAKIPRDVRELRLLIDALETLRGEEYGAHDDGSGV